MKAPNTAPTRPTSLADLPPDLSLRNAPPSAPALVARPLYGLQAPPEFPDAGIPAIASPTDARGISASAGTGDTTALLRLLPQGGDPRSALQTASGIAIITHYGISRVSPAGAHCPCAIISGRNTCNHWVIVDGEFRLPCRGLTLDIGLDHTRICETSGRGRVLISSQYDGAYCSGRRVNAAMALLGLRLEVSETNAWFPGRALSVIIRDDVAGSVLRRLRGTQTAANGADDLRDRALAALERTTKHRAKFADIEALRQWADRALMSSADTSGLRQNGTALHQR